MKLHKQTQGFAAIETVLIIIVLGIIGFTGWFVYHSKQATDKTLASTGNSFVSDNKHKSTTPTAAPETTPVPATQQYLNIKEWGVKIPVSGQLSTAAYSDITQAYGFNVPTFQIRVTDPTIPSDQTCKGGVVAWIERVQNRSGGGYAEPHYIVGNYAYGYVYPQDCTASQSTGVMLQAKQAISQIVAAS